MIDKPINLTNQNIIDGVDESIRSNSPTPKDLRQSHKERY